MNYAKYSELIFILLVEQKQNELLKKNYNACPTRIMAVPGPNAVIQKAESSRYRRKGRGQPRWKGKKDNVFEGKNKLKGTRKFKDPGVQVKMFLMWMQ